MEQKTKEADIRLLSVKEACGRLGIAHWKFYDLVHQHAIKTVRIGKRRLISTRAIEDFINKQERHGA
ncbi:MAG: helix-turn-helix domain-containing protein [Defluviitaleaceae bacterium]|nr:helix-turn-helix domain-containing protein [Defluviitaleaceae bacterium]